MTTTEHIRAGIENHCCWIDGVEYTFRMQSAVIEEGDTSAVLEIQAVEHDSHDERVAAIVRVRAPLTQVRNLPDLLTKALHCWVQRTGGSSDTVH